MDVIEIDAASNNGVDEIRDLREKGQVPPGGGRSTRCTSSTRYTCSPPARLTPCSKRWRSRPPTPCSYSPPPSRSGCPPPILSRCQRFDFKRLSVEDDWRAHDGGAGRHCRTASDEALHEIARAAEGAMRDALSILDVCLSYTDGEVELALVRDVLGTAGREFLFDFAAALLSSDARSALLQIDELLRRGLDPQVFAREVRSICARCCWPQTVGEAAEELLECTPEDAQRYREQAGSAVREQLFRLMELFMRVEPT